MFRAIWSLWWRWFNGPYDLGGGGGSVGWIAVGASLDRVVKVQCYMVCVI